MSKLLSRAKVKFANACIDYTRMNEDDAFLDDTCFNLHQSIEMCLKYLIEMQGEIFDDTHDIRELMNKLKSIPAEVPCEENLRAIVSSVNQWGRYEDDLTATVETINKARETAENLLSYCDKLVKERALV